MVKLSDILEEEFRGILFFLKVSSKQEMCPIYTGNRP